MAGLLDQVAGAILAAVPTVAAISGQKFHDQSVPRIRFWPTGTIAGDDVESGQPENATDIDGGINHVTCLNSPVHIWEMAFSYGEGDDRWGRVMNPFVNETMRGFSACNFDSLVKSPGPTGAGG